MHKMRFNLDRKDDLHKPSLKFSVLLVPRVVVRGAFRTLFL